MSNQEQEEELHKPIIIKFEKRKVYSSSKDNIWGADLANMQLISRFNKRFRFSLRIDIYRTSEITMLNLQLKIYFKKHFIYYKKQKTE